MHHMLLITLCNGNRWGVFEGDGQASWRNRVRVPGTRRGRARGGEGHPPDAVFAWARLSELRESGQLDRIVKALATYAKGTYVEVSPDFGGSTRRF